MIDRTIFAQQPKEKKEVLLATVVEVYTDGIKVRFDGEKEASSKLYKRNKSVSFSKGDRVKMLPYSGTYIVEYAIK